MSPLTTSLAQQVNTVWTSWQVIVSGLVGATLVVLAILTYRLSKRVAERNRRHHADDPDLDRLAGYLDETLKVACRFAQHPATELDFEPLREQRHLLESDDRGRPLHDELEEVVRRIDFYVEKALPAFEETAIPDGWKATTLLTRAMQQQQALAQLKSAVKAAQQEIHSLRSR
ncbi:hypothetical protein ACFWBR_32635 [Streptomyces sp. NPDC060006]|jgi:hypothetical protein|uniref:hypothetical protein n=1 Tax=unclassified Streptomyces TaxID=2593676 RepID=UPI0022AC1EE3|nr:hypothetical protein [Streptomyces aurantiacus]WAU78715.1 hypothetical protein O1Q96_02445 [Streptomyces aurantiacus]